MPIALERKIKASIKKAHPNYSEKRVKEETYRIMNKHGWLKKRKK